jgi:hypothetical protein
MQVHCTATRRIFKYTAPAQARSFAFLVYSLEESGELKKS